MFQGAVAALVLPLLVVVGTASARTWFRCEYDSNVRRVCCCAGSKAPTDAGSEVAFTRGPCCDRVIVLSAGESQALVEVHRFDPTRLDGALVAVVNVVDSLATLAFAPTRSTNERPALPGSPLILLKHSLLL